MENSHCSRSPAYVLYEMNMKMEEIPKIGIAKCRHGQGPLLHQQFFFQYKKLLVRFLKLHLKTDKIGLIRTLLCSNEKSSKLLLAQWFREYDDLFTTPLKSSDLRIFVVGQMFEKLSTIKVTEIQSKCVLLPYKLGFTAIPLINLVKRA